MDSFIIDYLQYQILKEHCILVTDFNTKNFTNSNEGVCPRGVMVKAFKLQLHNYVHFQINTLGKGMNPLILPFMG